MPTHITPEFGVDCQDCDFYTLEFSAGAAERVAEEHIEQMSVLNGSPFQPNLTHYVVIESRNVVTHCDHDGDESDHEESLKPVIEFRSLDN